MSSRIDPIRLWRLRMRATWLLGSAMVVAFGWWTFLHDPSSPRATNVSINLKLLDSEINAVPEVEEQIDPNVFGVKLWNPPPPPPTPATLATSTEPPRPLKLQLVGIISKRDKHRAAVYDPDTDRLLIVVSGDRIGVHTITAVNAHAIELTDGRSTRTLSLREDHS